MADNCQPETNITLKNTYVRRDTGSAEREVESNHKKKATCNDSDLPKDKGDDGKEIRASQPELSLKKSTANLTIAYEKKKCFDTVFAAWDTFCQKSFYKNDQENFLRICLLLGNPVRKAVLHQFKIIFKKLGLEFDVTGETESLQMVLHKHRFDVLKEMTDRKLINIFHHNLMFPVNGTPPDMEKFDLSLMTSVLWTFDERGILKPPLDEKTKKALKCVRFTRNEIVHGSSSERSDDFTANVWDKLTSVVQTLGLDVHVNECESLKTATSKISREKMLQSINNIRNFDIDSSEIDSQYEGNNFIRICLLMTQIVPVVVRTQFKEMFSNADISHELEDLRKTGITCIKSVDDMDVPLMLSVMKHKKQVKVLQNVIPDPFDVTFDADMTRINYYTNFIVDNRNKGLSAPDDFENIWKTVSGEARQAHTNLQILTAISLDHIVPISFTTLKSCIDDVRKIQ